MTTLTEHSNRLLTGQDTVKGMFPMTPLNQLEEVVDGVAAISSFANVAVIDSGDGLVLIDTGGPLAGDGIRALVRTWNSSHVDTAIYTHGHIDHIMGTSVFDSEATDNGWPRLRVVAHEAIAPRLDRYCLTAGYNASINQRQFQAPGLTWPTDYRHPDDTFARRLDLHVGEITVELHHDRGETDDHTWAWIPERRTLCTGDLFIWCVPNAGNPQKVQRYARDWALGLRKMAACEPEVLLPGHGLPIRGATQARAALIDTADLLDSLVDQTLSLMNQGATLDVILHDVSVPDRLTTQPYLQPIYDEPEFIVRNIWRLYGGWYDGNPARLKPAPDGELAAELAELCGGAEVLASRAAALAEAGNERLATHLIELAGLAAPDDPSIHATRRDLFEARAANERSFMAKGIFRAAAADSTYVVDRDATPSD